MPNRRSNSGSDAITPDHYRCTTSGRPTNSTSARSVDCTGATYPTPNGSSASGCSGSDSYWKTYAAAAKRNNRCQ